jgi:Mn2+/Fe2+ NRAMP family transporter
VGSFDTGPRRTFGRRLATLLAIMGPGLVVMVADNDAGGLAVYSQAGQGYGPSLLWVLLLLAPVLFINQEMVARLGAVTGAGHARLIRNTVACRRRCRERLYFDAAPNSPLEAFAAEASRHPVFRLRSPQTAN